MSAPPHRPPLPRPPLARQPRAEGRGAIGAVASGGLSRLARLEQGGSARILIPDARDAALEAVLLNTAGGITGGDRLDWAGEAGPGARLVLTTQAAERAYRAQPGETGRVETRLTLAPLSRIDWLPQETILFDGCAFHRRLEVDMAVDATLLAVEAVILGRAAMGERVGQARFRDRWSIRRAGVPVLEEALRLEGDVTAIAARPATLAGATAFASILLAAPDAADRIEAARALAGEGEGATGGASTRDGLLLLRLVARDGLALRRRIVTVLGHLLGRPLPRVWQL